MSRVYSSIDSGLFLKVVLNVWCELDLVKLIVWKCEDYFIVVEL